MIDGLICLIGAGRSGTNLLALTFDAEKANFRNISEQRYIWNYGQKDLRCDIRAPHEASGKTAKYIRHHFLRIRAYPDEMLVDKTPSNALRLPFVAAIFPSVKLIHIIRDGRDNVLSRQRQWESIRQEEAFDAAPALSWSGKVRVAADRLRHFRELRARGNLPLDRVPTLIRDMGPTVAQHLLTGRPKRYAERVPGLAEVLRTRGIDAAAAVQWRDTVMTARVDGRRLGHDRYLEVYFEDFVRDPVANWRRILEFLEQPSKGDGEAYLRRFVRADNLQKWRKPAERERIQKLEPLLRPTLEYLGYPW